MIQLYKYIHIIFKVFSSIISEDIEYISLLYNRTLLLIQSIYKSLHLLTLTSHSISPPNPSRLAKPPIGTVHVCVQSCLTICDHMDCSPPGSSVCGIFQARILQRVAISCCRRSSWPRNQILDSVFSCIGRWILYYCTTWEVHCLSCSMS